MAMKKKLLLVFGTRPEAIKMAPVYQALKQRLNEFETIVCVTAQHREMLDQVLDLFKIKVDVDLDLMKGGQDLFDITTSVLIGMRNVLKMHQPDIVMVHGDTTTAFATALACFYNNIPVWHVEAGLRTYDLRAPFPEEFNRQLVSKLSEMHFAPTELARQNLLAEGIKDAAIIVTGNTVIDALFSTLNLIKNDENKRFSIINDLNSHLSFDWMKDEFILITGHRRENFGDGFRAICLALRELAISHSNVQFVYPVHLNPSVQAPVNKLLKGIDNIHLIAPLAYASFTYLLKHCYFVVTDSGGIQEEAPSFGKPVLVLREVTERPEAVTAGTVILVGSKRTSIINNVSRLLEDENFYSRMSVAHNPYGDGNASERIMSVLLRFYED